MNGQSITQEEIVSQVQSVNNLLVELEKHPDSFTNWTPTINHNPAPERVNEILEKLRTLAIKNGDSENINADMWELYEKTEYNLEKLLQMINTKQYQTDYPLNSVTRNLSNI